MVQDQIRGTVAIVTAPGEIAASRVDFLLQSLDEIPPEQTEETISRLRLCASCFRPTLFEPTFSVPGLRRLGPFNKDVIFLSLAPNVIRSLYRHREHGFLTDPGGFWLSNVEGALKQPEQVAWFRKNFVPAGRLSVDDFAEQFTRLVGLLRERTGAHIIVTNVLTVEPGDRAHNYQLHKSAEGMRRREFCLALTDLSADLDFHILDVDRILKREGVDRQIDFAHFPSDLGPAIAAEGFRILTELEVF